MFSVVMPAYKAKHLASAIQSILDQTYTEFELIVVDDCSPENLNHVVKSFCDERLKYFRNKENIGGQDLVAQWMHAISFATKDYLVLASDDDLYEKTYLEQMAVLISKHPDVKVFRPLISHVNENLDVIKNDKKSSIIFNNDGSALLTCGQFLNMIARNILLSGIPQFVFNRNYLIKSGGFVSFPAAWYSDDATVAKLAIDNGLAIINSNGLRMRIWSDSITGAGNSQHLIEKKLNASIEYARYIKNTTNLSSLSLFRPLLIVKLGIFNLFLNRHFNNYLKTIHSICHSNRDVLPVGTSCIAMVWYIWRKTKNQINSFL